MLDDEDLAILADTRFLLAKRQVSEKTQLVMAAAGKSLVATARRHSHLLPNGAVKARKVAKGENYRGLPYFMLDCPAVFERHSVFAFRVFCWWGNFFSCTLHLQGRFLDERRKNLSANRQSLVENSFSVGVADSPWEHHFGPDNYCPAAELDEQTLMAMLADKPFVKLARQLPLSAHLQLGAFACATLETLLQACGSPEPGSGPSPYF